MRLQGATLYAAMLIVPAWVEARPVINTGGVVHAASYQPGIAQGSLFLIFGTGLGPASLTSAAQLPLPRSLAGVMVTVTDSRGSAPVPLAYVSATQIAAILPSTTAIGSARVTVAFGGSTSDAASFAVVRANFAAFAADSTGKGAVIAQNFNSASDLPRNSSSAPAAPGQTVIVWGTGLGATTGDDAEAPRPANMNSGLEVLVGGVRANVMYNGRSGCCSGVDQVTFQIPNGVEGCQTPVEFRLPGTVYSQTASLAVAPRGSACTKAGTATQYNAKQFRFTYPSKLIKTIDGPDPHSSRYTLVQLKSSDGLQVVEVRYASHRPDEVGWLTEGSSLTDTFGRLQVGGIFFDDSYPTEASDAGFVFTTVLTGNKSAPTVDVIGSSIWSRFDFAHIAYAYDRARTSRDARDMIFNTLTFATAPSVLGHWVAEGSDFFFNPDSTVEIELGVGATNISAVGKYSFADDRMQLSYTLVGTPFNQSCGWSVTLAQLKLNCQSGLNLTLHTMPDLLW